MPRKLLRYHQLTYWGEYRIHRTAHRIIRKEKIVKTRLTAAEARAKRFELEEGIKEAEEALERAKDKLKTFQDTECPHENVIRGHEYDFSWIRCDDCYKNVSALRGLPDIDDPQT